MLASRRTAPGVPAARRITAHVGLPDGYCGAAGPLLSLLGVSLEGLREAISAALGVTP
jgi:hypothetical protein